MIDQERADSGEYRDDLISSDRPTWTPVYMGEGKLHQCSNCGRGLMFHDTIGGPFFCYEPYLRQLDGDR